MVGREKSKQARSKRSNRSLKEDKINQLPDPLLCQILSHLTTKEAISTSVLSTRWRSLWLWVPRLELNSRKFQDFNAFQSFGNRFFDSSRVSCIDKLKLTLDKNARNVDDTSYFTSWINAVIKRKIQHLDIRFSKEVYRDMNRLRLYNCETLVYLRLFEVVVDDAVFGFLPCLKKMYLERNWYPNAATLEKLITSCPVLERLKIVTSENDRKVYRVHSRSLKRLTIERDSHRIICYLTSPGFVIEAPQLRSLTIDDHTSKRFLVNNLETNAKLNISLYFGLWEFGIESNISSRRNSIRDFLPGISRVGNMRICPVTFKLICGYTKIGPLPQFCCMSQLCVSLYACDLEWLEIFIRSCPNLKSLILVMQYDYYMELIYEKTNQISFPSVPKCLLSSLEFVDFKLSIQGHAEQILKLVRYFLENSAILNKFTLRLANHSTEDIMKSSKSQHALPNVKLSYSNW